MRLVRAELLKIRRRQATYVTFIVALVLMGVTFLIAGFGFKFDGLIEFPDVYGLTGQFAYGLGGLLAVVYSAAFMGADWNWGVLRNVVARGESRAGYLMAKAAALAIVLGIALVILYLFGIVMAYVTGWIHGVPVASPLRGRGLMDLIDNIALGYPVLIQRAALGFAVAVVVRSQIAGAVVGILLFLGESIVKLTLLGASLPGRMGGVFGPDGLEPIGPEWYQYMPVSVGDYVIGAAPGGGGGLTSFVESFLIRPVPLEQAMLSVLIYLTLAMVLSIFALNRQEIA